MVITIGLTSEQIDAIRKRIAEAQGFLLTLDTLLLRLDGKSIEDVDGTVKVLTAADLVRLVAKLSAVLGDLKTKVQGVDA